MGDWWSTLSGMELVYWAMAIPLTIIFLVLLTFSIFTGIDTDMDTGDLDAEIDGDSGVGFHFITLKNLIGFFTIFAWAGIVALDFGASGPISILIAFVSGLAMMTIMALMFYYMSKLQGSGTLIVRKAINGIGEVYLTIPAKRSGMGKVQIKIQGALRELEAITDNETDIKTGTMITVVDVVNDELLIVKTNN